MPPSSRSTLRRTHPAVEAQNNPPLHSSVQGSGQRPMKIQDHTRQQLQQQPQRMQQQRGGSNKAVRV